MLTRANVLSLTIAALLVLTLTPGAPFGYARDRQGGPTTAAPPSANPAHPPFSADAQTSGGLLIAVPQERLEALLAALAERGVVEAAHGG